MGRLCFLHHKTMQAKTKAEKIHYISTGTLTVEYLSLPYVQNENQTFGKNTPDIAYTAINTRAVCFISRTFYSQNARNINICIDTHQHKHEQFSKRQTNAGLFTYSTSGGNLPLHTQICIHRQLLSATCVCLCTHKRSI